MTERKKLFVALLGEDQAMSDFIGKTAAAYQVETTGIVWKEEPGKPVWGDVAAMIAKANADGWLIAGKKDDWLADPGKRCRVSLAVLKAANLMGEKFLLFRYFEPDVDPLPLPLAGSVALDKARFGARLIAKLSVGGKKANAGYRLDVHPLPAGDGFVAEIGPVNGAQWNGALFALHGGGEITHHTVGPKGAPPEKGVVEYAMKGVKLEKNGAEYNGWAVKNSLDDNTSYYLRVSGSPTELLFGQLPENEETELYSIALA